MPCYRLIAVQTLTAYVAVRDVADALVATIGARSSRSMGSIFRHSTSRLFELTSTKRRIRAIKVDVQVYRISADSIQYFNSSLENIQYFSLFN